MENQLLEEILSNLELKTYLQIIEIQKHTFAVATLEPGRALLDLSFGNFLRRGRI